MASDVDLHLWRVAVRETAKRATLRNRLTVCFRETMA
jgi:hypothetical protein